MLQDLLAFSPAPSALGVPPDCEALAQMSKLPRDAARPDSDAGALWLKLDG